MIRTLETACNNNISHPSLLHKPFLFLDPLDKLTELQKKYYDYTCQEGDCIRTCMVPSPQLNENDLEREKKILSL